jgi:hypothetical protein
VRLVPVPVPGAIVGPPEPGVARVDDRAALPATPAAEGVEGGADNLARN